MHHELLVAYRSVGGFLTDWATNISRGGLFINTRNPLAVGTEVKLIISLPDAAFPFDLNGRVTRVTEFEAGPATRLTAELIARPEDILLVGNGALMYRRELEEAGSHVEFASAAYGFPAAATLVELAIPRFQREDFDRLYDVRPYYVRKSDAEIAWDKRRRTD